jgi:DNA processing protein
MQTPSSRAAYVLALSGVPGIGSWTAVTVTRAYADPSALFEASPEERQEAIGRRFAGRIANLSPAEWPQLLERAERTVAEHEQRDIRVVTIDDDDYPPLMAVASDSAAVLYVRGAVGALRADETVAVIGTRKPTRHGLVVARRLASRLAESGFVIVSGLAAGIDEAGHEGALDVQGTTVAVLGTAIDKIYPARNRGLADRILDASGTLISEYPMGFPTSGRHFVERDRLQAAMSIAVVAVQTGVEGGTLHTVRFARKEHRAVVVPQPLAAEAEHEMYGGIHALIARGEAIVVETQDDYPALFAYLRASRDWLRDTTRPRPTWGLEGLAAVEQDSQPTLGL